MAKNPAGAPGGVLYEPRSLWTVANVDTTPFADFVGNEGVPLQYLTVKLKRDDLRNGQPYPITITRIAMMPLNYIFAKLPSAIIEESSVNAIFDVGNTAINQMRLRYGVPGRQFYSRYPINVPGFGPLATWGEPTTLGARSNVLGICRLNYERPLYIPRTGSLEMQISSPSNVSYVVGEGGIPNLFADVPSVPAEILYLEEGGLNPGSARSKKMPLMLSSDPNQHPNQNGWPYALPPYFAPATTSNGIKFWHRPQTFSAGEFRKQEATRAGSTKQLGVSIMIDQYDYDTALINAFSNDGKIAPLSTRVGTKMRSVDFGSCDDWWRPGAPMALTFDSITPAIVLPLPQPITLQTGDCFEVELQVPGPQYFAGFGITPDSELVQNAPSYQIGVSFNGFATVNG